jgi:hypothetical protein
MNNSRPCKGPRENVLPGVQLLLTDALKSKIGEDLNENLIQV